MILSGSQLRGAARGDPGSQGLAVGLDTMDRVVGELQRRALDLRTTPLQRIVEPLPRLARELAKRLDKRVELTVQGAEIEVDRSILDRLSDPLVHLVRNAVDHGVESPEVRAAAGKEEVGHIEVDARRAKDAIRIAISDDGKGIDLDAVRERAVDAGLVLEDLAEDLAPEQLASMVFRPGLSTAEHVSDISGRGVGMDAVRATIESLGGTVEIATQPGRGTTTTLVVPITAAVQRVLLVGVGGETIAIPVAKVERIIQVPADSVERSGHEAFTLVENTPVAVLSLADHVALADGPDTAGAAAAADRDLVLLLAEIRGELMALEIDCVVGHQQIYVKPVPEILSGLRPLSGLTILPDGVPAFLLDLNQLQ